MAIYKTAYDTTVGRSAVIAKIKNAILETVIQESLYSFDYGLATSNDKLYPMFLASQADHEANIPFFVHPMLVTLETIKKEESLMCTDLRAFATYNKNAMSSNDLLIVKNRMELDLAKLRTTLNIIWLKDRPASLKELSFVPAAVYGSWISESISKRYALDPKDQLTIMVLSIIFYNGLFTDSKDFTDLETVRMVSTIMKITKVSSKMVTDIIDRVKDNQMQNITEFANTIKVVTDNTRLQDFNAGALLTLLITSWFGSNSKDMLAVALEHPPTWLAIVYSSFVERTYKNSGIAKISQRYALGKGETEFVRSLVALINNSQD